MTIPQQGWQYFNPPNTCTAGKHCPVDVNPWSTDNTLKVTHQSDAQKDTIIAMKMLAIMSFSLFIISLMVKVLGTYNG